MTSAPSPRVSRARAFPLIWVVPIVAIAIGGWMGFRELRDRGKAITIDFADGSGVEAGRTVLEYKGVSAGTVEAVELRPGLAGVSIRLRLTRSAESLARAGAQTADARDRAGDRRDAAARPWDRPCEGALGGIPGLGRDLFGFVENVQQLFGVGAFDHGRVVGGQRKSLTVP